MSDRNKLLWAGDRCPGCGQFLSECVDHSSYLPEPGVHYTFCKRCGWEEMS
jgi:hypothetical protein